MYWKRGIFILFYHADIYRINQLINDKNFYDNIIIVTIFMIILLLLRARFHFTLKLFLPKKVERHNIA